MTLDHERESRAYEQQAPPPRPERAVSRPVVPVAELTAASLVALQRTAGNLAANALVQREAVTAGDAFAGATSGTPSSLPHLARMEQAFGQSFAGVRAHVGTPEARSGLRGLGARAAAFGQSVAFAETSPDQHVVAHELAHVVQQRRGAQCVQSKAAGVSASGEHAELAADRAADAVVRGERVPDVGVADAAKVHRTTVNTNGGVFDNGPMYAPVSGTGAAGERVGANIMVDFIPGDLVEAPIDGVVLTQTVKGVTDHVPGRRP